MISQGTDTPTRRRTALSTWAYWIAVVYACLGAALVLPVLIESFQNSLSALEVEGFDTLPAAPRLSFAFTAPVAIALAFILRSAAALWIYVLYLLSHILPQMVGTPVAYSPASYLIGLVTTHPIAVALQLAYILYLIRSGELRKP